MATEHTNSMSDLPWLPFYGDIPASISYPDKSIYDLLADSAAAYPAYSAIRFLGQNITYRRLLSEVDRTAAGFWALGLRPGDRVATILPNMPHAAVLLYAANRIGVTITFLHAEFGVAEANYILQDVEPRWIITTQEHLPGVRRIASQLSLERIVTCDCGDYAPVHDVHRLNRLRNRFALGRGGMRSVATVSGSAGSESSDAVETSSWMALLAAGSSIAGPPGQSELHDLSDVAVISYTGGTSGNPLGVMLTDHQLNAQAFQCQVQGPLLAGQTLLTVAPVSHGYGLGIGVHSVIVSGARTVMIPHYTPSSLARSVRKLRPEYLVGVPKMFSLLIEERAFRRARLSCLMGAFSGGDRLSPYLKQRFELIVRKAGGAITIQEGYGMTETVAGCATTPEGAGRYGSVGIPYPDTEIRISHAKRANDEELALEWMSGDQIGEICVCGPSVMKGYWRNPSETRQKLVADGDGRVWLRTGDLGRIDEDGYLYFVQREGSSCSIDGETVMPGLTERLLNEHPAVRDCRVVADQSGERDCLHAHIVPVDKDMDETFLENDLRLLCSEKLGASLQPSRYTVTDELPQTVFGVVDYEKLGLHTPRPHSLGVVSG